MISYHQGSCRSKQHDYYWKFYHWCYRFSQ